MTAEQFIAKWKLSTLGERQAAQPHFLDLCELLSEAKPEDPDNYCFERGALKASGRRGWADVWKRGHFAWEYKGKGANLDAALAQLQQYALALENPPLLVVCDLERFLIVTNWTNTVSRRISLRLDDLVSPAKREILKQVLSDPERLKPGLTREQITAERALSLAGLARDLRARGHHPERVAKFLVRLVFCMFAQGIGLLPRQMLTRMLEAAEQNPAESEALAEQLFQTMATGGWLGFERVRWFDGGLFDVAEQGPLALPMDRPQILATKQAAERDWAEIDPSILGTLFVQSLDPKRMEDLFRSAGTQDFGAVTFRRSFEQYTDRDKIMKIIEPVIERPLAAEWSVARERIQHLLHPGTGKAPGPKARGEAQTIYKGLLDRLRRLPRSRPRLRLRQLPVPGAPDAQGPGVAGNIWMPTSSACTRRSRRSTPRAVLGIDLNPFAIADRPCLGVDRPPAMVPAPWAADQPASRSCSRSTPSSGGTRCWRWMDRERLGRKSMCIVGNPPFLSGKLLRDSLGDATVERMFTAYDGRRTRVKRIWSATGSPRRASAWSAVAAPAPALVATNSIRGGTNRKGARPHRRRRAGPV